MTDGSRLASGVHADYKKEAVELGPRLADRASDGVRAILTDHAQAASRALDDNHVGTEHLVLGIYDAPANAAQAVLDGLGVSRARFASVLDDEPGPSPSGFIPYTARAMMIGGLAVLEADATGGGDVTEGHLLLGVVAESRRWERQHAWGPHHLRAAAALAHTSLDEIAAQVRATLGA